MTIATETFYGAPFAIAPGRPGYVVVRKDGRGLARVMAPSDWLLTVAAATTSVHTLRSKAESIAAWWEWCVFRGFNPLKADSVKFSEFVVALQSTPKGLLLTGPVRALPNDPRLRKASTISLRITHIKTFYKWAHDNGRCPTVTAKGILGFRAPRVVKKRHADRLWGHEVALLQRLNLHPRDRFLVELLYGTGLREGEMLGLQVPDFCSSREVADASQCSIPRVAGPHLHVVRRINSNGALAKSTYPRIVPLPSRVITAYRDWQAWLYDHHPNWCDSPYLVVALTGVNGGKFLTISGFRSRWLRTVQATDMLRKCNPHLLRHTYASELSDAGVPLSTIQDLLGHMSPESTEIYTHPHFMAMANAANNLVMWRRSTMGA